MKDTDLVPSNDAQPGEQSPACARVAGWTEPSMGDGPFFPFQRLDAYRLALELAFRVHSARISDPELRDQATRAAKSVFLNLCEGLPDIRDPMRRKYFLASDGSLHEVVGAIDLARAIGAVDDADATGLQHIAFRLRGLLLGLLRVRRS